MIIRLFTPRSAALFCVGLVYSILCTALFCVVYVPLLWANPWEKPVAYTRGVPRPAEHLPTGDGYIFHTENTTRFFEAVHQGNTREIRSIIEAGEDVNQLDARGFCALHYAARSGDEQLARLLVRYGASRHVYDKNLKTLPYDLAIEKGFYPLAEFLRPSGRLPAR